VETTEKLTYTVEQAGAIIGVSRTTAYKLCRAGVIPTIRFGRQLKVPIAQLQKLLTEKEKGQVDG